MKAICACVLALSLAAPACKSTVPEPVAPTEPRNPVVTPIGTGRCFGSLNESTEASKPFPADLVKDRTECVAFQRVEELHCPGVYVAIADGGGYGGSVRYFDGDKKLIGVWVYSDTNQFCNGTSFDMIYGTRPTCPFAEIATDLCRR